MTRDETVKIIRVITDVYPNYRPDNLSETINVWAKLLSDYSSDEISVALKAYILTDNSGFAPSIGALIEKCRTIQKPNELNEMEAWALVSKALRNSAYRAEEEYNKLPVVVQKAVGSPSQLRNWSELEGDNVESVLQSNFLRTFRTVQQRDRELEKMPSDIKALIAKNMPKQLSEDQPKLMAQPEIKAHETATTESKPLTPFEWIEKGKELLREEKLNENS